MYKMGANEWMYVELVNADIGVLVKPLNAECYLKIRHNQGANILEIRVQNQTYAKQRKR
jgi:hypothetical protein